MNIDSAVKELEDMLNTSYELINIPYAKGNSIRIKNYIVRKSKGKYIVFDCKENHFVSELTFKISAIAIAKTLSEGKNTKNKIEKLDNNFLKHYNDILFYKNVIKNTSSELVKDTRKSRMNFSLEHITRIKSELEEFVFGDK